MEIRNHGEYFLSMQSHSLPDMHLNRESVNQTSSFLLHDPIFIRVVYRGLSLPVRQHKSNKVIKLRFILDPISSYPQSFSYGCHVLSNLGPIDGQERITFADARLGCCWEYDRLVQASGKPRYGEDTFRTDVLALL